MAESSRPEAACDSRVTTGTETRAHVLRAPSLPANQYVTVSVAQVPKDDSLSSSVYRLTLQNDITAHYTGAIFRHRIEIEFQSLPNLGSSGQSVGGVNANESEHFSMLIILD